MKLLWGFLVAVAVVLGVGFFRQPGFGWILFSAAVPFLFVLNLLPFMIWLERKGSAYIQDRAGPERAFIPGVGIRLAGMVHNVADVIKLAMKEEIVPRHVHKGLYVLAPCLSMVVALVVGAIIPYAHPIELSSGTTIRLQALNVNVGMLWLLAASSVGVYSVVLAGWASNNKYGQLGGLRASASMISYEITLGLAVVTAFLVYSTTDLNEMVARQGGLIFGFIPQWGVLHMPVAFILFLVAAFAETNRAPFDLAEAESELVAGFHTEYGAFKFALFFMAEYVAIVVQCLIIATLFFGGWQVPWLDHAKLSHPETAATVLQILLWITVLGGTLFGVVLTKWHLRNRHRWHDARRREGAILAVLMGFGPAITALAAWFLWGGALGDDGARITAAVVQFATLAVKTLFFCWLFVWVRWTVPRFRYDQLMGLGWKVLLPLGIASLLVTGCLVQMGWID